MIFSKIVLFVIILFYYSIISLLIMSNFCYLLEFYKHEKYININYNYINYTNN